MAPALNVMGAHGKVMAGSMPLLGFTPAEVWAPAEAAHGGGCSDGGQGHGLAPAEWDGTSGGRWLTRGRPHARPASEDLPDVCCPAAIAELEALVAEKRWSCGGGCVGVIDGYEANRYGTCNVRYHCEDEDGGGGCFPEDSHSHIGSVRCVDWSPGGTLEVPNLQGQPHDIGMNHCGVELRVHPLGIFNLGELGYAHLEVVLTWSDGHEVHFNGGPNGPRCELLDRGDPHFENLLEVMGTVNVDVSFDVRENHGVATIPVSGSLMGPHACDDDTYICLMLVAWGITNGCFPYNPLVRSSNSVAYALVSQCGLEMPNLPPEWDYPGWGDPLST